MKAVTLLAALLSVSTYAAPSAGPQRRAGRPLAVNYKNIHDYASVSGGNTKETEYFANWSGLIQNGEGITAVYGFVVAPAVRAPSGGSANVEYAGSAWVGIGGTGNGCNQLLQTGFQWGVQNGKTTYQAWYEWLPAAETVFASLEVNEGDQIFMYVSANSTSGATNGSAVIHNTTTGKSAIHAFQGQPALSCQNTAEWIVEDFTQGIELVPFANYGTVNFGGINYVSTSGAPVGTNAQLAAIEQNGQVISQCSLGHDQVNCHYTG